MITIILTFVLIFFTSIFSLAGDISPDQKYSKSRIKSLAKEYVNNNLNINNPVMVDIDEDGDFDILKFNDGKVEYYKNTGSLDKPQFVLENKNFDNYEMRSIFPVSIPFPVFMADRDGDLDKDIFGIVERNNKSEIVYAENTMDLDHYTLITIILVLLIVVLIIAIV